MDQAATVTFVNDILDCMFCVTRGGCSWRVARAQRRRGFRDWSVFGLPVGWLRFWQVVLMCVWGPGVFGIAKSVQGIAKSMQGTSFGDISGDFGGACLTSGIYVSAGWQWELGSMPSGSGLAHWWLRDIVFWNSFLLCVRPWRGCFSWVTQFRSFPPCIVGLYLSHLGLFFPIIFCKYYLIIQCIFLKPTLNFTPTTCQFHFYVQKTTGF